MKPHKHAELIKQWADGATIERYWTNSRTGEQYWLIDNEPDWSEFEEYRIKPEQKPDNSWSLNMTWDFEMDMPVQSPYESSNLKVTFDGETGELKSAEVLK